MPIYYGSQKLGDLYIGSTKISEVYKGSTKVYSSSQYKPDQIIFESSTAGTYSLDILEDGKYEVTCVAGGAGGTAQNYSIGSAVYHYAGASGACFKGIINITKNTYSIVVGAGGGITGATGYWKGSAGGVSSIGNLVSCPSQKAIGHNGITGYSSNNGAPTVTATIISTNINTAGNNGGYNYSSNASTGGVSTYDNTSTGYGAGGSTYKNVKTSPNAGIVGYVKIIYKGK